MPSGAAIKNVCSYTFPPPCHNAVLLN